MHRPMSASAGPAHPGRVNAWWRQAATARPIMFDEKSLGSMYRHLDRWAGAARPPRRRGCRWSSAARSGWTTRPNQVLLASYGVSARSRGLDMGTCAVDEDGRPCAAAPVSTACLSECRSCRGTRHRNGPGAGTVRPSPPGTAGSSCSPTSSSPATRPVAPDASGGAGGRPRTWNDWSATPPASSSANPRAVDNPEPADGDGRRAPLARRPYPLGDPALLAQCVVGAARMGCRRVDGHRSTRLAVTADAGRPWSTCARRPIGARCSVAQRAGRPVASPLPRVDAPMTAGSPRPPQLPVTRRRTRPSGGVWVESGPYTRAEWTVPVSPVGPAGAPTRESTTVLSGRGRDPLGGDVAPRDHRAWLPPRVVAEGPADDFNDAGRGRRLARERGPYVAAAIDAARQPRWCRSHQGWHAEPGGRDRRTEVRVLDDRVSAMIAPGPGGRWETWVSPTTSRPRDRSSPTPTTPARSPRRWAVAR